MDYTLVISGTIGSYWNGCSADYVRFVLNNNKDKDVHVGFCSLGGYVKDGLEIHQAFKDHGRVHAHAFGMNASISTIAMLGCKTIDIVKGSFFLIHNVSVWIDRYEQANKEAIDKMINDLKLQRDSLNTFDDVLASMYSEKTGKSIDECKKQMKKGNWMTAQQAVDFGLVDSIRSDADDEKAANEFNSSFVNNYTTIYKDAGIPPLPSEDRDKLSLIFDDSGNPTQSFLQKTWHGLQNLIRNTHAENNINKMTDKFKKVLTVLNLQNLATDEKGNILLTDEQASAVDKHLKDADDKISSLEADVSKKDEEITKLKAKVEKLEKKSKEDDEQIDSLQSSAGDKTDDKAEINESTFDAVDLYNIVKDI